MSNLLEAKNLSKFYKEGNEEIKAVNNINFSIKENEKVVIYGRSGSGKSTLLNLLSGLDVYSDGEISYKNYKYDNQHKRLTQLRKENMGFVYQFHHLLKEFTSIENVALGSMILGENKKRSLEKWNLVAKTILHVEEWKEIFEEVGYDREWEFFTP